MSGHSVDISGSLLVDRYGDRILYAVPDTTYQKDIEAIHEALVVHDFERAKTLNHQLNQKRQARLQVEVKPVTIEKHTALR